MQSEKMQSEKMQSEKMQSEKMQSEKMQKGSNTVSEPTRGLRMIILAAIVLCIVASLTGARAGQDKNTGLRVAICDPKRLLLDYKYSIQSDNALRKKQEEVMEVLRAWQKNFLLSKADLEALSTLVAKEKSGAPLTAAEKMQMKKLEDENSTRLEAYKKLSMNQNNLSQAEKDKLQGYIKSEEETRDYINERKTREEAGLQKELSDRTATALKDVHNGIAKVAKEKGYNLVLSNEFAWFAETDITDPVLAQLNR